jgi:hypothetical protein
MTPSSRKVGVLTFHRCINYGSYWQARCLVEGLRGLGHEAVLLDHDSPHATRAEWRCALNPLLPAPTRSADRRAYAAKVRKFVHAADRLPLSRRFALDRPETMEALDVAIVGSDEVWNLRHPWYAGYPLFFGEGLKAPRRVAYAASFGNHERDDGLDAAWAERLRGFDAISVRDENSRALIGRSLGAEPPLVLDPCLQFDAGQARDAGPLGDYAVVYGHSFPPDFGATVRAWADHRGVRLVSIGYRNDWAHEQRLEAGPEEFADMFGAAVAVATNFFHGCVFSLLNGKPFVCATSGYRSNKVRSLATLAGVGERLVEVEGGFHAGLLDTPLDPSAAVRIGRLRSVSDAYLRHALH